MAETKGGNTAAKQSEQLLNVDLSQFLGGATSQPRSLGVPEGFVATRPAVGPPSKTDQYGQPIYPMAQIPARYRDGDQYRPTTLPPEDIARLQQTLDRAGLFPKKTVYRKGLWEDTSIKAYTALLEYANRAGLDADEALSQIGRYGLPPGLGGAGDGAGGGGAGGAGAGRDPLTITLTSPDDLRVLANRTARQTIGRKLDDNELSRFIKAYQGLESGEQQQAYGLADAGGTMTAAPSPTTFAETEIARMDPLAAEARKQVDAFTKVADMISSYSARAGKVA